MFGYTDADRCRRVAEPPKRAGAAEAAEFRGEFARDRARVLHSYAFRRLADKTQVVAPGEDDFPRTRLTHSLEVAQIGREIGAALGCDPDLTDTAGLAHDIGHPPFGHTGEAALDALAGPCGGFEGNAQTLRILTRLEAKTLDETGAPAGLNLTRAALDATCKYPWPAGEHGAKYGYYAEAADVAEAAGVADTAADTAAFGWLRAGAPAGRRCLEAQVMDWADDVAYSVHDVEDGVHAGLIRLGGIDDAARAELCAMTARLYSPLTPGQLAPVLDELLDLPTLRDLGDYDGSYRAQVAAKRATSELTGRFVGAAVHATRAVYGDGPLGRYAAELVVPAPIAAECALLKALAAYYVMASPASERLHAAQQLLITELVGAVHAGAPECLDEANTAAWRVAATDADRLRVVIDQVAKLTDSAAVAWHERLLRPDRSPLHPVR